MAAASPVSTTVTELPESRVRIEVEVTPPELKRRMDQAASKLGRDIRMPGFRKGKVPPPVVIRQLGRDAVVDEMVRDQIGSWYVAALSEAAVHPVGQPEVAFPEVPEPGTPLTFSVEIGVRPVAQLGDYKGVTVPRREPKAAEEAVQAELEQMAEQAARLESKEGEAGEGDYVVMDFTGYTTVEGQRGEAFEGGEGRDQLVELGSGRLIPGFEDQIAGAKAGEERTITVTFPDDYHAPALAGQAAEFDLVIKDVKEKVKPALDDDLAMDHAGFDTLDELKADIASKLEDAEKERVEGEFREGALDAVVAGSTIEVPDALVEARAGELWERMLHTLGHQGIDKDTYLRISGKTEEELLQEAKPDAEQALRREAVIAALVEAEDIQPSDGDVLAALQASATQEGTTPEKLRSRLAKAGRLDELVEDLAQRQAVDLVAEHAEAVPAPDEPEASTEDE